MVTETIGSACTIDVHDAGADCVATCTVRQWLCSLASGYAVSAMPVVPDSEDLGWVEEEAGEGGEDEEVQLHVELGGRDWSR